MIAAGYRFTCATARSPASTRRMTAPLHLRLPLITYGGAVRFDPVLGVIDRVEAMPGPAVEALLAATVAHPRVEPLLFAMLDGRDRVCWRPGRATPWVDAFVAERAGDPRLLPLDNWRALADAPVFFASLIGARTDIEALRDAVEPALADCFHVVGPDAYHREQTWFEVMSGRATKAAAAAELARELGTDALIAFGDGRNDVPLLGAADHGCAVADAVPELLEVADEVLASNDDEGVAQWLERHLLRGP